MRTARQQLAFADRLVSDWNSRVKAGDLVEYRGYPEAEPQRFKARTVASVLSGHTAVVWLEGKSGCVAVEACKPVKDEVAA